MNFKKYLKIFKGASDKLDENLFEKKQIEIAVGVVLNSVFLKLYKKSWANAREDALTAESRIFFSIWIGDDGIETQKLFYNIHALKLRKLKGYTIQSRKFADLFRADFKKFENQWPNVSVNYGPLTLMEGWVKINVQNFEEEIVKLANNFLAIEYLIDDTLNKFNH